MSIRPPLTTLALFLLPLATGCSSVPTVTRISQVFAIRGSAGTLTDPIRLGNVDFTIEVEDVEVGRSIEIAPSQEAILVGGSPFIRRVRYSMFEVGGREHHFVKGDKVYVFLPRESGELDLQFQDGDSTVDVSLVGKPGADFVLIWRLDAEGGQVMYGRAILRRSTDGRYFDREGKQLALGAVSRGVRMTRGGATEPRGG